MKVDLEIISLDSNGDTVCKSDIFEATYEAA